MSELERFESMLRQHQLIHLDAGILALHLAGLNSALPLTRTLFRLMGDGESGKPVRARYWMSCTTGYRAQ